MKMTKQKNKNKSLVNQLKSRVGMTIEENIARSDG